ncbi:MAG TPA: HAMP domain-containing histidine kinase, partial [Spirochaetia bacterium]|nr:HAMP domain-containing histidine kinase [Spirochaetia bacterium]
FDPGVNGTISFLIERRDDELVFVYSDDGKGIEKTNFDKIFTPFYTTKRGQGGTGLGLNLVYNIVTQTLGGSISFHSVPGQGTSFSITFPLS